MATPVNDQGMDLANMLWLVGVLAVFIGAYGAERRWGRASRTLAGPGFHETVAAIEAGRVDAAGFGVLRRANHQGLHSLSLHLQALRGRIEAGQPVSLYDPARHRQIEAPTLEQFDEWADKHFPGVLN